MGKETNSHWLVNFISGISAGVAHVVCCAPLDTARTRMQVQGLYNTHYRGMLSTVSTIYNYEGVRGLYKGVQASLIAYPTSWSVYFASYDVLKNFFRKKTGSEYLGNLLGSGCAGILGSFISNPLWLIRARVQVGSQTSVYKAFLDIARREGPLSFFQGLSASLLGVVHVVVQFPLYEIAKKHFHKEDTPPNFLEMVICSCGPKVVAGFCSYPLETIRTRLFVHNKTQDKRFLGLASLISYTLENEGIKAFYSGYTLNLVRVLPATFITLYTYENVLYFLKAFPQ